MPPIPGVERALTLRTIEDTDRIKERVDSLLMAVDSSEEAVGGSALSFTNEAGVAGTVRLLTNVMGLWLLESCRREWEAEGRPQPIESLLAAVSRIEEPAAVISRTTSVSLRRRAWWGKCAKH